MIGSFLRRSRERRVKAQLRRALVRLPEHLSAVHRLVIVDGASCIDAASALTLSIKEVEQRLVEALLYLCADLDRQNAAGSWLDLVSAVRRRGHAD